MGGGGGGGGAQSNSSHGGPASCSTHPGRSCGGPVGAARPPLHPGPRPGGAWLSRGRVFLGGWGCGGVLSRFARSGQKDRTPPTHPPTHDPHPWTKPLVSLGPGECWQFGPVGRVGWVGGWVGWVEGWGVFLCHFILALKTGGPSLTPRALPIHVALLRRPRSAWPPRQNDTCDVLLRAAHPPHSG